MKQHDGPDGDRPQSIDIRAILQVSPQALLRDR
jgi:hypothetical protein